MPDSSYLVRMPRQCRSLADTARLRNFRIADGSICFTGPLLKITACSEIAAAPIIRKFPRAAWVCRECQEVCLWLCRRRWMQSYFHGGSEETRNESDSLDGKPSARVGAVVVCEQAGGGAGEARLLRAGTALHDGGVQHVHRCLQ